MGMPAYMQKCLTTLFIVTLLLVTACQTAVTEETEPVDEGSKFVITFPESVSPEPVKGRGGRVRGR